MADQVQVAIRMARATEAQNTLFAGFDAKIDAIMDKLGVKLPEVPVADPAKAAQDQAATQSAVALAADANIQAAVAQTQAPNPDADIALAAAKAQAATSGPIPSPTAAPAPPAPPAPKGS
jgi:hypothetical protein